MKLFRRNPKPKQPKQCRVKDTRGQRCTLQRGHDPKLHWLTRKHRRADGATFTAPDRTPAYYPFIDGTTTDMYHHHGGGFFF